MHSAGKYKCLFESGFYVKDRRSFKTDKNMEVWNETEECVNCCERY